MSICQLAIVFHPCKNCGKMVTKGYTQSINRYYRTLFCCNRCYKDFARQNEIGWFARGVNRINHKMENKEKQKQYIRDDELPILWTKEQFSEFYEKVPELALF